MRGAYQFLIDAAHHPLLHSVSSICSRRSSNSPAAPDRNRESARGSGSWRPAGVWICGGLGFVVVLIGIVVSLIPPGEATNKLGFEMQLVIGTVVSILIGLALYWRGARAKASES